MAIPQSKNQYKPRSVAHFEALEQTCRLRQLLGFGGKYLPPASGVDQGHSTFATTSSSFSEQKHFVTVPTKKQSL